MRGKRAVLNSAFAFLAEIVSVICGFILPRLILGAFGSQYNGIVASITQFLSYVILLRAGIGGVTRAALYKPLSNNDVYGISGIVNATQSFMRKISFIFLLLIILFAIGYPFIVLDEFDYYFSFSLVLILSISVFAQNFFGLSYSYVLISDQRNYIYSILTIVTTILNTVIASILIVAGATIHIVKLGSAIVFAIHPIVLSIYVKHKYHIDRSVPKNNIAIKQRWDAFAQQIAAFVNNNTDIVLLTFASKMTEVSVYTVYYLVIKGLNGFQNSIVNSFESIYGDLLAKNEKTKLQELFRLSEFICFSLASFVWICAGILIVPFVMVYTAGITDVSYYRPVFGTLACVSAFLNCTRMPYVMLVSAIGHFRQIRTGAIITPIINIIISIILVPKYGVDGVMVGTIAAMLFMNLQYSIYASLHILSRRFSYVFKQFVICFIEIAISVFVFRSIPWPTINNYYTFFAIAFIFALIVVIVIFVVSYLFERELLIKSIKVLRNIIRRKTT